MRMTRPTVRSKKQQRRRLPAAMRLPKKSLEFSEISHRAWAASMSKRPLRARSDREIMPTSFPSSTTGSRRTWWRDIRRVASRQSAPGETVAQPRVMMSRTGVWAGSSSAATHRSTISRSVTIPRSRRSSPHTGREPTLCRLMSRAARAAEEPGSTVTTLGFIRSLTCIITKPPFR